MPELPEVEVTRLGLQPHLPGREVKEVRWSNKRLRQPMPRKLLKEFLPGTSCRTVDRRGKYLLLRMENGSVLVLHLGMTGKLSLVPTDEPLARHYHFRLNLDNRQDLRFNDSRRFGSISIWPSREANTLEKALNSRIGLEPFSKKLTADYLLERSRTKSQPIKNFLMDGRVIAGIGNIYANEILFQVSVHPATPARLLNRPTWKKIITACRRIMNKAIEAGGSSISDFLGTSGNPGYFQFQFKVYGRKGHPCSRCKSRLWPG